MPRWSNAVFMAGAHPAVDRGRLPVRQAVDADRPCAPAAVHQARRSRSRSRALPDRLRGATAARLPRPPPDCTSRRDARWRSAKALSATADHAARRATGRSSRSACGRVEEHRVEPERFDQRGGGGGDQWRVRTGAPGVAVGTTTTRALEARRPGTWRVAAGAATTESVHLSRVSRFRIVGGLMTNFHLPQSSLLMLVAAFAGTERVLAAYREAVAQATASTATAMRC